MKTSETSRKWKKKIRRTSETSETCRTWKKKRSE
jgi:hypothetical protein